MDTSVNCNYLHGKKGRIYAARRGTILVYLLSNGESWFANTLQPSNVIFSGPVRGYWASSIDYAGSFSAYFTERMAYDEEDKPHYPLAEPLVPLTGEQIEKLSAR